MINESHRALTKNFETHMWVDEKELLLNHMMQETLGNVLAGFSKTLKGANEKEEYIEVKIKKLHQPTTVDAHKYP